MPTNHATEFLKVLKKSGIVEPAALEKALTRIGGKSRGQSVSRDALIQGLVQAELITQWHARKLTAGKYKGFVLGKYVLLDLLGSGGMSSVYLARHRLSGQLRAIKVLPRKKVDDKSYLDRFYLEARAAASLNDPNVVRIYDVCNEGDTHYMVMEYVRGDDLHQLVSKFGPMDFQQAAEYTRQAARGLLHAHQRGLVHRDIKPANLLLTENRSIKILDLGLALMHQEDSESLTVMYNERVMGTADYLSPEQAVNSHQVDHRADIYSLGCTLYFLLVGHPPFPKGTLAQRIASHQTREPTPLRELRPETPPALEQICHRMMSKNPDDRFQDCEEIIEAVERFLANDESPATAGMAAVPVAVPVAAPVIGDAPAVPRPVNPQVRTRAGRKPPPAWLLPVAILIMFIILVGVLVLVARTLA